MTIRVWNGVVIGPTGQKLKQIIDLYPGDKTGLYVTSGYRSWETTSHHGGRSYNGSPTAALDIGFGYGVPGYQSRARAFAAWLYQYSNDVVELIVSKVGSPLSNGGYYVKNTVRVGPYAHTGSNTSVRHEDHVHFATSSLLADRIIAKIKSGSGGSSPPKPSAPSQAQISVTPWTKRPVIRRGDSGGAVGHAQFLLRDRLGYSIDKVSGTPFGPQTETAVRSFQKEHRLLVDGIVGSQTWSWLEVKAAKAISPRNRPVLRQGSEGMWVGYAQHCLRKDGYKIDDLQSFPFGPQTNAAVRSFQHKYGLLIDGVVGSETYSALDAAEAGVKPIPPDAPVPEPPNPDADYSAPSFFVPREEWGAHPAKAVSDVDLSYWKGITIHHSGGEYATVKDIQEWMMFNRPDENDRLADVGYSFLIRDGKVHVGRGFRVRPAHDGINTTLGVCVIGNYGSDLPSSEDRKAIVDGIKEIRKYVGRELPVDRHRDRGETTCPGDALADWVVDELPPLLNDTPPALPPDTPPAPIDRLIEIVEELLQLLQQLKG